MTIEEFEKDFGKQLKEYANDIRKQVTLVGYSDIFNK